jgi:GINS complex protein
MCFCAVVGPEQSAAVQDERVSAMESDPDLELERIIYERDLQRTRWLIKAYYRMRIRKIEQHVQHYLHHQEYTSRLSAAELDYAKGYFTCIGRCVSAHAQGVSSTGTVVRL